MVNGSLIPQLLGNRLICSKAGGEDLVNHLVFRPAGQQEALLLPKGLGAVEHLPNVLNALAGNPPVPIVRHLAGSVLQLKKVPQADHVDGDGSFVIVPVLVPAGQPHVVRPHGDSGRKIFLLGVQAHALNVPPLGLQADEKAPLFQGIAVIFICKVPDCRKFHMSVPLFLHHSSAKRAGP